MNNLEKESLILYLVLEINSFFFHFKEIWLFSMPPMAADSKQVMVFSINAENKGSLLCRKNLQSYFSLFEVLKVSLPIRTL